MKTNEQLRAEFSTRKGQTSQLLKTLQVSGEITTRDLHKIGTGCSSRLNELRKEGHKIVAVFVSPGLYRYVYLGQQTDADSL